MYLCNKAGIPMLDENGNRIEMKRGCNSRELSTPRNSTSYPRKRTKGVTDANIPT